MHQCFVQKANVVGGGYWYRHPYGGQCPHCGYCPTCGRPRYNWNYWGPYWATGGYVKPSTTVSHVKDKHLPPKAQKAVDAL